MRFELTRQLFVVLTSMTLVLALAAGCERKTDTPAPAKPQQTKAPTTQPLVPVAKAIDWCKEHGVPESVCAQCNTSLAADFKAKGDWCEQHNAPKSQCFKCSPELKEKFAAAFKEEHGKEPPPAIEPTK